MSDEERNKLLHPKLLFALPDHAHGKPMTFITAYHPCPMIDLLKWMDAQDGTVDNVNFESLPFYNGRAAIALSIAMEWGVLQSGRLYNDLGRYRTIKDMALPYYENDNFLRVWLITQLDENGKPQNSRTPGQHYTYKVTDITDKLAERTLLFVSHICTLDGIED